MQGWRKSTYSGGQGNCVEVATGLNADAISIRDTTQAARHDRVTLTVAARAWRTFTTALKYT